LRRDFETKALVAGEDGKIELRSDIYRKSARRKVIISGNVLKNGGFMRQLNGGVSKTLHFLRHENCGNPRLVVRKLFLLNEQLGVSP
jgi:hypothetical protein